MLIRNFVVYTDPTLQRPEDRASTSEIRSFFKALRPDRKSPPAIRDYAANFSTTRFNFLIHIQLYNQAGLEVMSITFLWPAVSDGNQPRDSPSHPQSLIRTLHDGNCSGHCSRHATFPAKFSPLHFIYLIFSMQNSDEKEKWYVMRDLSRANTNTPAWQRLSEMGFEVYTPMTTRIAVRQGKRIRETLPVIHDLLFVHSTRQALDPVVDRTQTLQYRYGRGLGYCVPMTVRDSDMAIFMQAVSLSENPVYYLPSELTADMIGRRVRIIGGPMDGFEGSLLKMRGSKRRKLLVTLDSLLSIAVEVSPEFITLLP